MELQIFIPNKNNPTSVHVLADDEVRASNLNLNIIVLPRENKNETKYHSLFNKAKERLSTYKDYTRIDCNRPQSHWSEIKCDFLDEEDHFWRVDAWLTDNDSEDGKVIAYIDDWSGRVLYVDTLARDDAYAQNIINERIAEIKANIAERLKNLTTSPLPEIQTIMQISTTKEEDTTC